MLCRRELRDLNAPYSIVEATKISEKANEIHFTLASVKKTLDRYDISRSEGASAFKTLPNLQAVMIMLCIRTELNGLINI